MKSRKKYSVLFAILVSIFLILAACAGNQSTADPDENNTGNNNEPSNEEQVEEEGPKEKITIKVAFPLNEDYFNGRFGGADAILDHIDLEYVPYGNSSESLQELFANGVYPDIIVGDYPPIEDLELQYPLDELIEKHGFDLDRFDPSLLSLMRALDPEGRVVGFPDGGSFFGLYYNKEVFDVFGIDYPDPDKPMTWDEVLDLARQMTVKRGDVQYVGLGGGIGLALSQFAANTTHPDTGEVLIERDPAFRRYFELYKEWVDIPGMRNEELPSFAGDQTVAMYIASNNFFNWGFGNPDPSEIEHFDIAPVPVWPDMPNTTAAKFAWVMAIPNYVENKDAAFEVLAAYMDKDVQIEMAKTMYLQTPLRDPEILEHWGSEVPQYKGKNIKAKLFGESAEHKMRKSKWDSYVHIGEIERRIREEGIDVTTALREEAEAATARIKEAMATQ